MTTLGQWSRLLDDQITTPLPDAGLGPATGTTRAGNPNAFAAPGPERPQEYLHSAYQGAADVMNPMLYKEAGGQLARGAFELADSKIGQGFADVGFGALGLVSPLTGGVAAKTAGIIGLPGIMNLSKSGLRHADDWGGANRVDPALDMLRQGASREEAWRAHGIARELPDGTPMMQPFSYLDPRGMDINPDALAHVSGSSPPMRQLRGWGNTLGDVVDWPEMYAANPGMELVGLKAATIQGPREPIAGSGIIANGGTYIPPFGFGKEPPSRYARVPRMPSIEYLQVTGSDPNATAKAFGSTLGHEMGHVSQYWSGLPNGANETMLRPNFENSRGGRSAMGAFQRLAAEEGVTPNPPGQMAQIDALDPLRPQYHWPQIVRDAAQITADEGRRAAYWQDPGEKAARYWQSMIEQGIGPQDLFTKGDPWNLPHINLNLERWKPDR